MVSEANLGLVPERQQPLRQRYLKEPDAAWITDGATAVVGEPSSPFSGEVEPANNGGTRWTYGIHRTVGGDQDAPNPGDLLCASLAACLHSTTRMVAQWLGLEVIDIQVNAAAQVDVRGTLGVDATVPVGFQQIRCTVRLQVPRGVGGQTLKNLTKSAERRCVVLQTINRGIWVGTDWHIDQETGQRPATPTGNGTARKEVQS